MSVFEMRSLYIIPIVHTAADLGRLSSAVDQWKEVHLSPERLCAAKQSVARFWQELQAAIRAWQPEFQKLRLYQDALPVCGDGQRNFEHQIVQDLAARGSTNHQLLQWLVEQGATLTGTESATLLLEEYKLVRETLQSNPDEPTETIDQQQRLNDLLVRRDRFIAERIHATLQPDQIGLIFIGMLHRLHRYLPVDIEYTYPFGFQEDLLPVDVKNAAGESLKADPK